MEWLILTIGPKTCCVVSSGLGALCNSFLQKRCDLSAVKNVALALIIGWIAAEFFIPPIMKHFQLDMTWGPAIAFLIGYMGIRLLPMAEEIITKRLGGK